MGTPEFAVAPLERLLLDQYEVVAVYTQPDSVAGRGQRLVASPTKTVAMKWHLPVIQPASFRDDTAVVQLASFYPDIIVVAAYGQILPQAVLDIPTYGCINIHPSLLPRFRGASPVTAAILAGSEFTGVTIMLMSSGLDTGPILARAQIPVAQYDTTGSLMAKLSRIAAPMLLEVLPGWWRGELAPRPQDENEATYSGLFTKADGEIDWRLSAVDIWRRVRAFQPWPGCYTWWQGRQLKIIEAVPLSEQGNLEVGQVVALHSEGAAFGVNTGAGVLGVLKVQMEGKRVMSADEFVRGQRQFIGALLPSV